MNIYLREWLKCTYGKCIDEHFSPMEHMGFCLACLNLLLNLFLGLWDSVNRFQANLFQSRTKFTLFSEIEPRYYL